ncbi:MAG TPA: hypothetical protein VMX97_17825 [Hyphomicrobiaceae bacterium]|nr:hypothetical protein [Hyphomicrobiaceae bacterium]
MAENKIENVITFRASMFAPFRRRPKDRNDTWWRELCGLAGIIGPDVQEVASVTLRNAEFEVKMKEVKAAHDISSDMVGDIRSEALKNAEKGGITHGG